MALLISKHRFYAASIYVLVLSTVIESLPDKRIKGLNKSQPSTSGRRSTYVDSEETIFDTARTSVEQWAATDQSLDPYIYESTSLPDNPKFYPSVGNGHLGHTVYRDSIFVNGIYSGELGWSHRARIPAYHSSNFSVQSATSECTVGEWTHQLNLRTGTFTQTISFPGVNVITKVYAHQYYNRILVTEVTLERKVGCGVCCNGDIEILREDLGSAASTDLELQPSVQYVREGCPAGGKCWSQSGTIKEREVAEAPLTSVTIYVRNMPPSFTLTPADTTVYHFYIVSIDQIASVAKDNFDAAIDTILSPSLGSNLHGIGKRQPGDLHAQHVQAFNNTWTKGTIDIQGDLHLAKVIHGCLYYLYTSLPSETTFSTNNQFSGLSPGGLPNGANNTDYQGHVFWDMETWMYPPILMFRPDLAKDMLSYRISRITPAFERAVQTGYQGARFPWESAFTGVEVTPDICPACRDNQQHITGDIAYAARQYLSSTWDIHWLDTAQAGTEYTGFQFITEMARFWQSRPKLNEATGRYDIAGVMPPDEHQENVTNSIYTNVGASYAIHFADFAGCLLLRPNPNPEWLEIAQKLAFTYNSAKQYHEEFEGYDEQVETNTTDIRGVKQADVVMLGFPFLWDMPSQVRTNDQLWYETVTHPNGPAMTWGIYSINWLDLGNFEKADEMFNKAYQSYAREPFKVWTEVQSGDGAVNFITGMGGFLQTIVFGYAGLRLDVTELRFNKARLPPGATQLSLKNLNYLGAEFDVHIDATTTTVAMITTGGRQLHLITSSDDTLMGDGVVKSVTHQSFVLRANPIPNCKISKPEIDVVYPLIQDTNQGNHITSSTTAVISLSAIALVAKILSNY